MNTRGRAIIVSVLSIMTLILGRLFLPRYLGEYTEQIVQLRLLVTTIFLGVVLILGTIWVLFYKVNLRFLVSGALFPVVAILPFLFVSESLIVTLSEGTDETIATVVLSSVLGLIIYIMLLTVNILNGARMKDLPLGQAAKASQFIILLVSAYLFFTFVQSSIGNFLLGAALVVAYVSYMSFSAIAALALERSAERAMVILISLVLLLSYLLISLWPVSSVYSTVVMTIIFYMLLNIALEMREMITRYIWIEYALLFFLIFILLVVNAVWGVQGSIV